jgi:hypothetical protein
MAAACRPLRGKAAFGAAHRGLVVDFARDFNGTEAKRAQTQMRAWYFARPVSLYSLAKMSRMFQSLAAKTEGATSFPAIGCVETPQSEGMGDTRRKARPRHFSEKSAQRRHIAPRHHGAARHRCRYHVRSIATPWGAAAGGTDRQRLHLFRRW